MKVEAVHMKVLILKNLVIKKFQTLSLNSMTCVMIFIMSHQ